MSKVSSIIFLLSLIINFFIFMVDHEPQTIKPAIVKWLELLEVSEKNIPSFLYSLYSSEQIPYFYYIDKIFTWVPIFILTHFIYNKVKNYYTFKCLYHWLFKFISSIKNIKKPVFISFHNAIVKIMEQLDIEALYKNYNLNKHTSRSYLEHQQSGSLELFVILTLIQEEKIILYARRVIENGSNYVDTRPLLLQRIPIKFFNNDSRNGFNIYDANCWADNYCTIVDIHGKCQYTEVSIKSKELDNFIQEHKSTNLLTSKHIT